MTKDEFIQKITIFGVHTVMTYLVALNSDNPTVMSAVESLFVRMGRIPLWKQCNENDVWSFLMRLDEGHHPKVVQAAESLRLAALMCYGDRIAKITFVIDTVLLLKYETHRAVSVYLPAGKMYIHHSTLEDNRHFMYSIASDLSFA